MRPSSVLPAAAALVLPALALATPRTDAERSETLYALNTIAPPVLEFGRFFDAAARPPEPPVEREPAAREPVVLDVPPPPPAFVRTFRRLMKKPAKDRYDELIRRSAEEKGLDPRLVKSVIAAESEFTQRAKSPAGALGLMQVRPATADEMGVPARSLFDPAANIRAGTRYLAYLFGRAWLRYRLQGTPYARAPEWVVQRVIAAYNAGPRWVSRRPMYRQTREYVRRVLLFYKSEVSELRNAARATSRGGAS
jgi:soluble lytic murein transglycosylase-like protein